MSLRRWKKPRRIFRPVKSETHALLDQQVFGLESSTVGLTKDILTLQSSAMTELRPEKAILYEKPPHQLSNPNPCSATLFKGTESHCEPAL